MTIHVCRVLVIGFAAAFLTLAGGRLVMAHNLKGHPEAIDRLLTFEFRSDFEKGFYSSTQSDPDGSGFRITLQKNPDGSYSRRGYFESAEINPGFLVMELLPSWNIELPPGTGYAIQLSVRGQTGAWSPWYYLGGYKAVWDIPFKKNTESPHGKIDVDHWVGNGPARLVKFRVWLFTVNTQRTPSLQRFFLHARGYPEHNPAHKPAGDVAAGDDNHLPAAVELDVPWRSQAILGREIRGSTCCPTSVAMILEKNGHDEDTTAVARMMFDGEAGIFGVWPRASQAMSEFGLRSYVTRYRSLEDARRTLATGQPIIASIKAREGELPEAPYRHTNGHLFVIVGYEGDEAFIVNDPATRDPAKGRRVRYSAEGMQKTWIDNGGVAIIGYKP